MENLNKIKVENIKSNKGNIIPNQFIIRTDEGEYFQSYKSLIAFVDDSNNIFLDKVYYNYSKTTSKYRNIFLNLTSKEIETGIKTGAIKLLDLNGVGA